MYIPKHYAETDQEKLRQFIRDNGFGILFSHTGEEPMATHLPFVLDEKGGDRGVLLGHVARANPQWKRADNQRVLAV
ncbi:MAG: FMN-binding negative transcriptional regulator, partial [Chloroflexi bacterium]|nr:FMN-binding negative transcriptional regulator [Chloroflexota bacterium]